MTGSGGDDPVITTGMKVMFNYEGGYLSETFCALTRSASVTL
jgi:hypothetical protein